MSNIIAIDFDTAVRLTHECVPDGFFPWLGLAQMQAKIVMYASSITTPGHAIEAAGWLHRQWQAWLAEQTDRGALPALNVGFLLTEPPAAIEITGAVDWRAPDMAIDSLLDRHRKSGRLIQQGV